jgi:phospholipid transport system transporter-binding protein
VSSAQAWAPTGALTVNTVAGLRTQALSQAAASGRVDLSGVTEADSAALALLVALIRDARAAGRTLRIVQLPEGLQALAALYDLGELLVQDAE